jgi:alkylation response protein AidB-like acyl-CoA dehydrogenase
MDFDFTEDHEQLRDAVRKLIDKSYGFERRRAYVAAGGFDTAAYAQLAELGLTGLCIGESYGGMNMGSVESMIVMEELGRGLALEPLAASMVCGVVIENFAPEAMKQAWLPKIASGEAIVSLAAQERGSRYGMGNLKAKAATAVENTTLFATKNIVIAAQAATAYLVPAVCEGKLAVYLVQRQASGVSTTGYQLQDGSRAGDVVLTDAPAELLTREGEAAMQLAQDCGIANACAYAVGVMDKTVLLTAEYMNTRKQFGVPIASFQALRHRMADMKMQLELARSMSYFVNMKLGAPARERSHAASLAKYQLGQSMRFVGQQGVQLHGGIGVTDEYIMSHYFKTLTQLEMMHGDSLHHLAQISEHMQETAGVFA